MRVVFKHRNGREQAMHRRYADVLQKLGRGTYSTREMKPAAPDQDDDLSALRAEYQEVVGKRPFHGWDAETLRAKISEAQDE